MNCKDGAQVFRRGGVRPVVRRNDLRLLPAIQVEPPCRRPLLGMLPPPLGPPSEAVEDVSRSQCAGSTGHHGRRGVWRLAWGQGRGAIQQVHVPREQGLNSLQVRAVFQRSCRDPHLVVVAVLQYHHGNIAGGASRRRLRGCLRPNCLLCVAPSSPGGCGPSLGPSCVPSRRHHCTVGC